MRRDAAARGAAALCLLWFGLAAARPTVRDVKTMSEWRKLLKHHAENTGLPVIVDFYSDGCGPCRQIAPHYKRLAEEYKGRAVFAKVDVNLNHAVSSEQQVRSMPTFQMYLFGKKRTQFSGADVNQLTSVVSELVRESKLKNVEVTLDAFKAFYAEVAPDKVDDEKLLQLLVRNGKGGGPGHYALVEALKKKYAGKAPKTQPRAVEESPAAAEKPKPAKAEAASATGPSLHLASVDQLEAELGRRREAEEERRFQEASDDDEDDDVHTFPVYNATSAPAVEQLVIIGAGPAGLSAAIYAARAGLRPVVVAPPVGGQLQGKGVLVENYPGVNGTTGPDIVFDMQKQAAEFGTIFEQDLVLSVDLRSSPMTVRTNQSLIRAHSVILATGADSRWLGVPGEWDFRGSGVSACATCDGFMYTNKAVVVIGGGDTAMEDALVLARTSSAVTVVHRGESFRATKVLADRVLGHAKITVLWNSQVVAFEGSRVKVLPNGLTVELDGEGRVVEEDLAKLRVKELKARLDAAAVDTASVVDKEDLVRLLRAALREGADEAAEEHNVLRRVRVRSGGEERVLEAGGAFVAIGHDPNTNFVKGEVDMHADGYLVTAAGSTRTSVSGVFAAGDVADRVYRQAVTSAGSGAAAALDAERWLSEHGFGAGPGGLQQVEMAAP
ncbi:hypothetical protein T492DRAFT_1039152 [Pavlovales sp. CCMP2436]|nr:hypothetical protein T492DRAFT_1039152 [Pavlovales sp. CCMP2436]|mmetsp:Transcript_50964/g.119756  ORF Transcript_50964/g.119756 Transcript_50964/m.119756 type:complete len:668 (+) Transcript_50964:44-2047(+)